MHVFFLLPFSRVSGSTHSTENLLNVRTKPSSLFHLETKTMGFDVNVGGVLQPIVCNMRLVGSRFHLFTLCVWILHDEKFVAVVFYFILA